jgi:putative tryptophan/tyrosine transport system substrate-binding protein
MPRIGVLMAPAEDDPELKPWLAGFRERIEALGWTEGRNVHIDYRLPAAASSAVCKRAEDEIAQARR